MLNSILNDKDFSSMMQRNIEDMLIYLLEREQNFGILCRLDEVSFEPELPSSIKENFGQLTLFFLAGYTFESAILDDSFISFEAGFGSDNFGSIVSVPFFSITQIIVDESPLLINLSEYRPKFELSKSEYPKGIENSMSAFLSNPENSKFLKK